jgi:TonB family protein
MTSALWFENISAFALQLAAVIGAGLLLSFVITLNRPHAALAYWRVVLLACLLMPMAQPWRQIEPKSLPALVSMDSAARDGAAETAAPIGGPPAARWSAAELTLIALAAGVTIRALWLMLGAVALIRLRRTAKPLVPEPKPFADALARLDIRAAIAVSDRVSGPITFGLFKPIVIVPPGVLELDADVQEAIAYHELLHVRRRDWVDEVGEELVRTIFWFHPAMWWLVDRIRLTREQVVDHEAIALTASRERYVHALVSVALARRSMALVPAPLFLRRSHLKQRIARILQETTMTTRRLIASLTLSTVALGAAAVLAVRAFPLQANAAPPASGAPVAIVKGGEHLLHAGLPEYPRRAIDQKVEGDVVLEVTLDDRGEVSDARVLTGPDELRKAALESVLNWHYSPAALRSVSNQITLRFHLPPPESEDSKNELFAKKLAERQPGTRIRQVDPGAPARAEHQMSEIEAALKDPSLTDEQRDELKAQYMVAKAMEGKLLEKRQVNGGARALVSAEPMQLQEIRTERVSQEAVRELLAQTGVNVGDTLDEVALKRFAKTVQSIDEHLRVYFVSDRSGKLVISIVSN